MAIRKPIFRFRHAGRRWYAIPGSDEALTHSAAKDALARLWGEFEHEMGVLRTGFGDHAKTARLSDLLRAAS